MWYGDAAGIEGRAFELVVAALEGELVGEHVGAEVLAFVGADLAFGQGGELEDGEVAVAVVYLYFLVVVDAVRVGAAAHYSQPDILHSIIFFFEGIHGLLLLFLNWQLDDLFGSANLSAEVAIVLDIVLQKCRGSFQQLAPMVDLDVGV